MINITPKIKPSILRINSVIISVTILLFLFSLSGQAQKSVLEFPDAPFGKTVSEVTKEIRPGVFYIHRTTDDPMQIHVLTIDLTRPEISLGVSLGKDTALGIETVASMARRKGALAGINGDYWTNGGIALNLVVVDGEIVIAPKHRTAFAVTRDGKPMIGMWTDSWSWSSEAVAPDGSRRWIRLLNSDCNEGWLSLYSSRYGAKSRGDSVSPETEVVLDKSLKVLDVRTDMPGVEIPEGGFVLTGRNDSGQWLAEHFKKGDTAGLDIKADKPLDNLYQAIGAGPRILKDGEFVQDSMESLPAGEEFTRSWKETHYLHRQPRSLLGLTKDRKTLILATVDGRQAESSIGIYQHQGCRLLQEFGAWDGMDLDSGGSATMVVEDDVINNPSDKSNPDGTGGRERPVANALLVYYDDGMAMQK